MLKVPGCKNSARTSQSFRQVIGKYCDILPLLKYQLYTSCLICNFGAYNTDLDSSGCSSVEGTSDELSRERKPCHLCRCSCSNLKFRFGHYDRRSTVGDYKAIKSPLLSHVKRRSTTRILMLNTRFLRF